MSKYRVILAHCYNICLRDFYVKLPDSSLIEDPEMKILYEYDMKGLFNSDERKPMRFRYETKLNLILDTIYKRLKKGENVIDIGCAQGNYTLSIAARGIYSIGLDLRRSFIKYAKMKTEKNERANVDFLVANAECLPFKSKSANCIYLGELLEHLSEPTKVLEEMKRVLKAESSFSIISTPNAECFGRKARMYTDICLIQKNELDKLKHGSDTHIFEFTNEEFLFLLSNYYKILWLKYLWPISPIRLLYKIPLSSKLVRRIETILLNISPIGRKFASDMVCMITPK